MIDESKILDDIVIDLQKRLKDKNLEFGEEFKLREQLLKTLSMRRKDRGKKGRGFDLGST